jgi:hypothetical protein
MIATAVISLWRIAYFGTAIPNTYTLKVEQLGVGTRLDRGITVAVASCAVGLAFAGVFALAAAALRPSVRRPASLIGVVFAAQLAYSAWVGGDAWEWMRYANRYITVGAVPLLCLAAVGIEATRDRGGGRWLVRASAVAVASAVVYMILSDRPPLDDDTAVSLSPALVLFGAAIACGVASLAAVRSQRPFVGAVTLVLVLSLPALSFWWLHGGAYVDDDAAATEHGLLLGDATRPGARIAVVAAGSAIYFADRPGVDILGKSDPRIAELPPRPEVRFLPGHSKWDHSISVGESRPDVVAQLRLPTDDDREMLADLGYVCVRPRERAIEHLERRPSWFALEGSDRVHWEAVELDPDACG